MIPEETNAPLYADLVAAYQRPVVGWDFSSMRDTRLFIQPEPKWDYRESVRTALHDIDTLLDMDTGGGEMLSSFQPLPPHTYATEGYAPNLQLARQRLTPLGVTVCEGHDTHQLPFDDNQFDLIINRHASYDPAELLRVLKLGQRFITQQVGSRVSLYLHALLGREKKDVAPWNLSVAVSALQAAGGHIVYQAEDYPIVRYLDVRTIVFYLKHVPWEVPDFSIERYYPRLLEIDREIQAVGYVDVPFYQFFIVAKKPVV
jgi:hypothetical protein